MTPAARLQTAIELLDTIIAAARDNGPAADTVIAQGFKARRYAGSKDKRAIRDLVYRAIRAFGTPPQSGRAAILGLGDPELTALFGTGSYAPAALGADEVIAAQSPVADWMLRQFYPFIAEAEMPALLERAPLDLRVNRLKAKATDMADTLGGLPVKGLADALRFDNAFDVAATPAYQSGLVEVQDAGSQWISAVCAARPGMTVVDLCAGAGGKSLALAADMAGEGRLIASDTDRGRLSRLPERADRAGVAVETRLLNPKQEAAQLADLDGLADIVLVDAPCSGSGTWRRNPELRWRITSARLNRTLEAQAHVLDLAAPLVKPGGALVYAVCSLFAAEGDGQIQQFLARQSGWVVDPLSLPLGRATDTGYALTPAHDGTDGFFVARLTRNS